MRGPRQFRDRLHANTRGAGELEFCLMGGARKSQSLPGDADNQCKGACRSYLTEMLDLPVAGILQRDHQRRDRFIEQSA